MWRSVMTVSILGLSLQAGASTVPLALIADTTRTTSGALNFRKFKACAVVPGSGCFSAINTWVRANGVTSSDATWTWDGVTLTATGTFWTTDYVSFSPNGQAVIGDKTVNLSIDTVAQTTTATSYHCIEGNFLASVGVNGCLNLSTGADLITSSSALYNVGGNANCIQRTIAGDDVSAGNPRGLFTAPAAGACDAVDGAYDMYTVVVDNTATGGELIISNGIPIGSCLTFGCEAEPASAGAHWLTFGVDNDGDVRQPLRRRLQPELRNRRA